MNDFDSLIFYIISFLFSATFYYIYNKKNYKFFLILSFCIPMIIGGLRYKVGTDYISYVGMYNNENKIDLGFIFISRISAQLGGVQSLFFMYNSLTLIFIFMGLNNIDKKIRPFAYFCYLFLFYTTSFNIMRQFLAASIVFYAYKYIIKKEPIKWIIFIIIAFIFHNTSILCLPLYIILNSKSSKFKVIALLGTVLIAFNYNSLLKIISGYSTFDHYSLYLNDYGDTINNKMFFIDAIILIYILIFKKKLLKQDINNNTYILLYIVSVILSLTGFFNPYVKRIGIYFSLPKIILLSEIPLICSDKNIKILNYLFIIMYAVGIFIISAYVLKQANIIPYNMIGG